MELLHHVQRDKVTVKTINRHLETQLTQCSFHFQCSGRILDIGAFSNFDLYTSRRNTITFQQTGKKGGNIHCQQVRFGNVNCDGQWTHAGINPPTNGFEYFLPDILVKPDNITVSFQQRHKIRSRHHTIFFAVPAYQCFGRNDLSALQIHAGLQVKGELPLFHAGQDLRHQDLFIGRALRRSHARHRGIFGNTVQLFLDFPHILLMGAAQLLFRFRDDHAVKIFAEQAVFLQQHIPQHPVKNIEQNRQDHA